MNISTSSIFVDDLTKDYTLYAISKNAWTAQVAADSCLVVPAGGPASTGGVIVHLHFNGVPTKALDSVSFTDGVNIKVVWVHFADHLIQA